MTIRGVVSSIHNKEIELKSNGKALSENDILDILKKELKKRIEASEIYKSGNRAELAKKEKMEAAFISKFLPPAMSAKDLESIIDKAIKEIGNASQENFGAIMKRVKELSNGMADGAIASQIIKKRIS